MEYKLRNDIIEVTVNSFGAEIKSVKSLKNDREFMWYADKKFWGRTSPVLFPFVGSMKNKEFIHEGKHYPMGQHGFARDMEHILVDSNDTSIWFELKSSEETLSKFPFDFILRIGYELCGNEVKVLWEVLNNGNDTLPFSIGAHPAFICPINNEENKDGYKLSFKKFVNATINKSNDIRLDASYEAQIVNEIHHHGNTRDTGLAITEDIVLPLDNGQVLVTRDFFDRCTYMIEDNQANSVGLVDPEGNEFVTVIFDTPLFAIWSPEEKNAPFICIEPWYGRCDHVDFNGELKDRAFTNFLEINDTFHSEYIMKFNA